MIVTGVRAYERRPDLRANNNRLLEYVENGGTVIVKYNKQEFNQAQYGPYPAKTGTDRITDENAPVEVLVPDASGLQRARTGSGPDAWAGWVQERGTYFLAERDSRYVDLVRSTDPVPATTRAPKTGALVEARYGKGRWIYIGLGLWRQLPAGTEGAYQLMANLLSLRKAVEAHAVRSGIRRACVLNENFEDAKAQFLAPLMRIHYAHLVMLAETRHHPARRGARDSRRARRDLAGRRRQVAIRRHAARTCSSTSNA